MDVLQGMAEAMRRRDFIKAIGGTTVAWPLPASVQQFESRRIGVYDGREDDKIRR